MRAILLAGGVGSRLRPVVSDVPKPMAAVAGRPFLEYILDDLAAQGFTEVVLSVGYLREMITEHFGSRYGPVALKYSEEENPLGTGGAIRRSLTLVEEFPVFIQNADTFVEIDYGAMLRAHVAASVTLSMALRLVEDTSRYGEVVVHGNKVKAFRAAGKSEAGLINSGIYLVSENPFTGQDMPERFSFERDFLEPTVEKLAPMAYVATGRFIDIGVPEDYGRAQLLFAGRGR